MQLSSGAAENVERLGSYDRQGREIKYETPVTPHTSSVREDICIGTFNTSHGKFGKDCIDRCTRLHFPV